MTEPGNSTVTSVELTPRSERPASRAAATNGATHANGSATPPSALRRLGRELVGAATIATNVHLTRRHAVSLVHFVTRRCNARCSFCFIDFDHPEPRSEELSIEEIERLTATLGPSLINVNLTGGEPFLRGDLIDIARAYYRNTNVQSIYITSNGGFPDRVEEFARTVAREFPDRKLIVSLSIDAFPAEHDRIRKVSGLFDKAMRSYHALRSIGGGVSANIAITVSHENHSIIPELYEELIERLDIRAITAIIVRDEGVYEVPIEQRRAVLAAYEQLTGSLVRDMKSGRLEGYDPHTLQGRLMNRKNEMLYGVMSEIYLEPHFVSTCFAGSLFGVIDANGTVFPCEILDRPIGNLRDHDMDFSALWRTDAARDTSRWIKDTKCNCSYECAWAFNILGNARYQPKLIGAALGT